MQRKLSFPSILYPFKLATTLGGGDDGKRESGQGMGFGRENLPPLSPSFTDPWMSAGNIKEFGAWVNCVGFSSTLDTDETLSEVLRKENTSTFFLFHILCPIPCS